MRDVDPCPESGYLMLISPERVFYAGLLGRPRQRTIGGFAIYVALQGGLRISIDGQPDRRGVIAVVPPYLTHGIESDGRCIICLVIEPETVGAGAMEALARRLDGADAAPVAGRIRRAYLDLLAAGRRNGFTTAEFDTLFFGETLSPRPLDPRIARTIARLNDFSGQAETAAGCAAAVMLSQSRFLHLFKDQTGVSFRAFRAWKRARHLLHFVNADTNLAHLAQDIGYPDSTHFSHSIRRFYGLQPRAIFSGSRKLAIYRSDPADTELRHGRA
jgi:AraC-like DNA-binding protein